MTCNYAESLGSKNGKKYAKFLEKTRCGVLLAPLRELFPALFSQPFPVTHAGAVLRWHFPHPPAPQGVVPRVPAPVSVRPCGHPRLRHQIWVAVFANSFRLAPHALDSVQVRIHAGWCVCPINAIANGPPWVHLQQAYGQPTVARWLRVRFEPGLPTC